MRLRDIEVGTCYAAVRYYERRVHERIEEGARLERAEWDAGWNDLRPVVVLETRVPVPGYQRPGVSVQWLDRDTMEPRDAPTAISATKLLLPWDEWDARYHQYVEQQRELERQRQERVERERAEAHERNAREWMDREFARAREHITEVRVVIDGPPYVDGYEPSDDDVRKLVDHRNPDGNPYLNGTFTP